MSGYSRGAAAVIQAIQGVEDERETIRVPLALVAILNISPADSALSRSLRMDSVWDSTMREQLRQGMSGKPGTEHLRPRAMSGFRLQLLIERAEQYKGEAGDTLVAERHLARGLAEMLRDDLRIQGINGKLLVEEVTTLEVSPERKKVEEALDLERLRFAKAREEIEREVKGRSSAVQADMARRGITGSGLHFGAIISAHVEMLRAMARKRVELRTEMARTVPELGSNEHLDRLQQEIEEMVDAQWANLHIGVARSVGGVSAEADVRRMLGSGEFSDTPLQIKSEAARELAMLKYEVRLGMHGPASRMPSPDRGTGDDGAAGRTDGEFRFDVAISYAGPQRELAEALAQRAREAGFAVFFDRHYQDELWGKDLAEYFDRVFRRDSRYCVILASNDYLQRMWAIHERRSAVARSIEERGGEYILPVMVEKVEIPGLPPTTGYVALDEYSPGQIADMLVAKLGKRPTEPIPEQPAAGAELSANARKVLAAMLRNVGARYPFSFWHKEESLRLSVPNTDVVIEGNEARYVRDELLDGGYVEEWHAAVYRLTRRGEEVAKSL